MGLFVIFTGMSVVRETSLQLMDTMPGKELIESVRSAARAVPGAFGVEKCYARKTCNITWTCTWKSIRR